MKQQISFSFCKLEDKIEQLQNYPMHNEVENKTAKRWKIILPFVVLKLMILL